MSKRWITFFSRTGAEIAEVSRRMNRVPDLIITNKDFYEDPPCDALNTLILTYRVPVVHLPAKPTAVDYDAITQTFPELFENCVITLHGYLRIIPPDFCGRFLILNSHPGDIIKYPFLKGFNPQEKAFNNHLESSGVVVHRVVPEVDSGEIISIRTTPIQGLDLDGVYEVLHNISIKQWCDVLGKYIGE